MPPPENIPERPRVRRIAIVHRDGCRPENANNCADDTSLTVPENISDSFQNTLQQLDANHDGTVTYTPSTEDAYVNVAEAHSRNGTSDTLMRAIWGHWGPSPFNNRTRDREVRADIHRGTEWATWVQSVRTRVFERIQHQQTNPEAWREELQALSDLCTPGFLLRFGEEAQLTGMSLRSTNPTRAREFLDIAEEAYIRSQRLASRMPHYHDRVSQTDPAMLASIDRYANTLNPILDRCDQAEFHADAARPYLFSTQGSPITSEAPELVHDEMMTVVAVPRAYLAGATSNAAQATRIRDYLNTVAHPRIDLGNNRVASLQADRVLPNPAGPYDDPIDDTRSFHTHQHNITRTLFGTTQLEDVVYFHVGLRVAPNDQQALRDALGLQRTKKFDIVMSRDPSLVNGDIRPEQRIASGFVLQNTRQGPNRTVVASDIHIADRDGRIIPEIFNHTPHAEGSAHDLEIAERIYFSATERVLAAAQEWNRLYRAGEIDRVVLTGDLADFVNRASTLARVSYRNSNERNLVWVLSQIEAPLYVVSGNHDHHGHPYPISVECRSLRRDESLCSSLYEAGYDDHHFSSPLLFNGIKALIPGSYDGVEDVEALWRIFSQAYRDTRYRTTREDDFMTPYLRELGINENFGVTVGNNRLYFIKSGPEDFSYYNYLYTSVPYPRASNIMHALSTYVSGREVNGRGPIPEEFQALIYETQKARSIGQTMTLFMHYPVFAPIIGPDRTPNNADALAGDVSRAFRLLAWHYRLPDGAPVISDVITGHIHQYTETDFTLALTPDEERNLHRDLDLVFQGIDPTQSRESIDDILATRQAARDINVIGGHPPYERFHSQEDVFEIYNRVSALWDRMDLSRKMRIRSAEANGSEGTPTRLASSLHNSDNNPLFTTLPALGPESLSGNGYMILTTEKDRPTRYEMRYVRVGGDNRIHTATGQHLWRFLDEERDELHAWDPTINFASSPQPTQPTPLHTWDGSQATQPHHVDWAPMICQYPLGQTCLQLTVGSSTGLTQPGSSFWGGFNLLLGTSQRPQPVFGWSPNYISLGFAVEAPSGQVEGRLGTNHGLISIAALLRGTPGSLTGNLWLGGELATEHGLPIFPFAFPNIVLTIGTPIQNPHPEVFFGFRWNFTAMSYTPERTRERR